MRASFTDEPHAPLGFPLADAPVDALRTIARELGVGPTDGGAAALRSKLGRALGDHALLRGRLERMSPLALVTLEALVEARGSLDVRPLIELVAKRMGCSEALAAAACDTLLESGWVLALAKGRQIERVAIAQEAGAALYALLAGVSLPDAPPPEQSAEPPAPSRMARDMIAVVALAAHRRVTLTLEGMPNRVTLKRFAKGLGPEPDAVDAVLVAAMNQQLTRLQGERLLPDAAALVGAASGTPASTSWLAPFATLLRDSFLPVEALARASATWRLAPSAYFLPVARVNTEMARLASALLQTPGVVLREHAGHTWIKRVPSAPAHGDGHVTPSFEVLLGPGADLGTVARVALCCELVRIDHVLTLRLSAKSVTNAIAMGLPADELRAALLAVGPHGLPPNVEVMLGDWIAAARVAELRHGAFVFTDEATAEKLASALGDGVQSRPRKDVLQLQPWLRDAALTEALERIGASLGGTSSAPAAYMERPSARDLAFQDEPDAGWKRPLPSLNDPDPALRARVVEARAREEFGQTLPPVEVDEALALFDAAGAAAPPAVRELLTTAAALSKRLAPELRSFREGLSRAERGQLDAMIAMPLPLLPWLALKDKWRRRTLHAARSIDDLIECAMEFGSVETRLSPEGAKAHALIASPEVRQMLEGRAHGSSGTGDDGDEFDELDGLEDLGADVLEAEYGISGELRRAILQRRPALGAIDPRQPAQIEALFERAVERQSVIHVALRSGAKTAVRSLVAEGVHKRGRDTVILGFDLEALEPRALSLDEIRGAVEDAL